jgi:hypothetical protein
MALGYEWKGVSVVMSHQTRKRRFVLERGAPQTAAPTCAGPGTAEVAAILQVGASFLLPGIVTSAPAAA